MEYIYAALLLHKLGKEITEASLKAVVEATGTQVDEAKIKSLIASLKGVDIEKVISETTIVPQTTTAPTKQEIKKEEKPKEEEAAEGLSALFG